MIKFINLTNQINTNEVRFAFYNTDTECFCSFLCNTTWSSVEKFQNDFERDNVQRRDIDLFLQFIPKEFFPTRQRKFFICTYCLIQSNWIGYRLVCANNNKEALLLLKESLTKENIPYHREGIIDSFTSIINLN